MPPLYNTTQGVAVFKGSTMYVSKSTILEYARLFQMAFIQKGALYPLLYGNTW